MVADFPLPMTVERLPGEPTWSWLRYVATLVHTSPAALAAHLGLTDRDSNIDAEWRLHRAEVLSGLQPGALAEDPSPVTSHWIRPAGSRYCPLCLQERDGRWQHGWAYPWAFACQVHSVVLQDVCPTCRLPPARSHNPPLLAGPQVCLTLEDKSGSKVSAHNVCGTDLRFAARRQLSIRLGPDHPAVAAQQWLTTVLGSTEELVHVNGQPVPRSWIHVDIAALFVWALKARIPGSPPLEAASERVLAPRKGSEAVALLNSDAAVMAMLAAQLLPVFVAPTLQLAAQELLPLLDSLNANGSQLKEGRLIQDLLLRGRFKSPWLRGLVLAAFDRRRLPEHRLRANSPSNRPILPAGPFSDVRLVTGVPRSSPSGLGKGIRLQSIDVPTALDAETLAGLGPCTSVDRAILAASVLLVGSDRTWDDCFSELAISIAPAHALYKWRLWQQSGLADQRVIRLCSLAEHLASRPRLIDWDRRRRLWPDPPALFIPNGFRTYTRQFRTQRTARKELLSRLLVWQFLTGTPVDISPVARAFLGRYTPGEYTSWLRRLPPEQVAWHAHHAERHLLKRSLKEPITNHPRFVSGRWEDHEPFPKTLPGWNSPSRQSRVHVKSTAALCEDVHRRDLERFAVLADYPSAVAAASCTEPTAAQYSRSVRRLETKLGVVILTRAGRDTPQALTFEGKQLLSLVKRDALRPHSHG